MKKENRKMAQQRRAKERKKKALQKKLKKILSIIIPFLVVVLLAFLYVRFSEDSGEESSDTQTSSSTQETSDSSSADTGSASSYSSDTALTVEDGDTVNIDYTGTIDGTAFEGGSTDGAGADLVIGSGTYIDGFEDQLIGAHPGDTVEVHVTFPEDYGVEELNGKDAVFTVTVNGIYR